MVRSLLPVSSVLLGGTLGSGCATPAIEVGTGETRYEALADGDRIELVHGPQGGFHVVLALWGTGLRAGTLYPAVLTGTVDGEVLAEIRTWVQFRDEPEGRVTTNHFLIYEAPAGVAHEDLPAWLHTRETTVHVGVDVRGTHAEGTKELVVWDPIVEEGV